MSLPKTRKRDKDEKRIKGQPQLERVQVILRRPIPRPAPFLYTERIALMDEAKKLWWRVRDLLITIGNTVEVGEAVRQAQERYWESWQAAWDPELIAVLKAIEQKTLWNAEPVIRFLEADPWFPQSGHAKQHLIRHLTRQGLTATQEERLRGVVLKIVEGKDRREFKSYQRLARRVDSPELRAALRERAENDDWDVRRRARWMLEALGELPTANQILNAKAKMSKHQHNTG